MDMFCTTTSWPLLAKGDDCGEPQEGGEGKEGREREGRGGERGGGGFHRIGTLRQEEAEEN